MGREHVDGDHPIERGRHWMQKVGQAWAGIDAGKGHHHLVLIDCDGRRLLSRRVANDERDLKAVVSDVREHAETVTWAIDLTDGPAALVITLLLAEAQRGLFLPGVAVNRVSGAYRGEARPTRRTRPSSLTRRGCGRTFVSCA
jgi:hypothetical protein